MNSDTPLKVSVVLCTYNPRRDYLALALRSLGAQTMSPDEFEIVVVDNNSVPALHAPDLSILAGKRVVLTRESRQGLTYARIAGIQASRAPLIVFVDDDNELDHAYLSLAAGIADRSESIGTFGGVTHGCLERPIGGAKRFFLPYLGVRNYGPERIEGTCEEWGEWEPIGAGLVARRDVAECYCEYVDETARAGALGRNGSSLMSGEDTLMTRLAAPLGYRCAYEPALQLNHYISASRLSWRYLLKLLNGHGRTYVVLARMLGETIQAPTRPLKTVIENFIYRCRQESVMRAVGMIFWDVGFAAEARRFDVEP